MGDRWGTGRLEAFSDGVFAIAITLLILEVSVPESDFDNLWRGIVDQWPSYPAPHPYYEHRCPDPTLPPNFFRSVSRRRPPRRCRLRSCAGQ